MMISNSLHPLDHDAPAIPPLPIRVLLVDDDALNRAIVCRLLAQGKFEPVTAINGAQAVMLVSQQPFDVILMDWQMPDMNGLECTRRMRAGQSGAQGLTVPIIALTANTHAEDRAACLAAGMDDFLAKPVQRDLLNTVVTKWARRAGSPERPTASPPAPHNEQLQPIRSDESFAAYDPAVLPERLGTDDTDRVVEDQLLTAFTESWPVTLQAIEKAIAANDPATLRLQVHTLKSTAATIGALALAQVAARQDASLNAGRPVADNLVATLRTLFERFDAALTRHRQGLKL